MAQYVIGEFFSLLMIAFAVGMDAFSVSLGMGMLQLRLKRIAIIGFMIGVFHIVMPLLGIYLGKIISSQIGSFTAIVGACIIIAIGLQMIIHALLPDTNDRLSPVGAGLVLLAFTVSLDSFSLGLSLGMSQVKAIVAVLLFGICSTCMTWSGLLIGRKVRGLLGVYSEMLGGSILCGLGIAMLIS